MKLRNSTDHQSIRRRLLITLTSGAALLAFLIFWIVRGYAAQIAQEGQDDILNAAVTSILDAAILREGKVEIDIPYASFSILDTELDDRVFYSIYQDRTLLSGYENLPQPRSDLSIRPSFETVQYQNNSVRLVNAQRVLIGAQKRTTVVASVAQTQDALSGKLSDISRNVALFCAGFFFLIVLLSYWATEITVKPLRRLAASVKERGAQDLGPFTDSVPTEMQPLVSSLNKMMARLDASLKQSEEFIAEAAHRVRTPLATVRTFADATLQRVGKKENRDALRSMVRAIDESSRAAGQLLDHAMITFRADHLQKERLDLGALVEELAERMSPLAEMKDVDLEVMVSSPVELFGDQILIQNAIRNLIDNALKYSPNEGAIKITVDQNPRPFVMISDQGSGFPSKDIENLTTRFERGSNAEGTVGSGLGLTIAQDVAKAHAGRLELYNNSETEGACVILSF